MRQRGQHGDVRFHVTEREEGVSVGGGMAAGKASWRPANGAGAAGQVGFGCPEKGGEVIPTCSVPFVPVVCPKISLHPRPSTNTSLRTVPSLKALPLGTGLGRDGP